MVINGKDFGVAVAEQLRAERAAQNITIEQLAERSGLNTVTTMRYLNGARDIPVPAFIQLADGLKMTPQVILDRAEARMDNK